MLLHLRLRDHHARRRSYHATSKPDIRYRSSPNTSMESRAPYLLFFPTLRLFRHHNTRRGSTFPGLESDMFLF